MDQVVRLLLTMGMDQDVRLPASRHHCANIIRIYDQLLMSTHRTTRQDQLLTDKGQQH